MDRHVAIVVLTWNGREDTLECLASLADVRWSGPLTTIVVDNASTDGTAEAVAARFPDVDLVLSDHNAGFAGGNNLGIARALELGADDVLLLNNDTEVEPDLVEALEAEREAHPDAGALCPLILYAEPAGLVWYAGARFDPRRSYNGRQDGYGEPLDDRWTGVRRTERLSGCAVLLPRDVLEEVGVFDDALFLQYEDTDLSLRLRAAGRAIYVVGHARVLHKVSAGTGGETSPLIMYHGMRNCLEVCRRHAPLPPLRSAWRELKIVAVHLAGVRKAREPRANLVAILEGWRDHRRGRLGPRWATVRRDHEQRVERPMEGTPA
jgi:GT2 family glycosyltransferase